MYEIYVFNGNVALYDKEDKFVMEFCTEEDAIEWCKIKELDYMITYEQ